MRRKIFNGLLISLLVAACLAACALFTFLPARALNTELIYKGF
jgi:hypothetical protein